MSKSKSKHGKNEEESSRSCLCRCMEPILCSCYSCMAWLLAKVFLTVAMCFLIYCGFLIIVQRWEPSRAFSIAFTDFVNIVNPSNRRPE